MIAPPDHIIARAILAAGASPCRSRRGVVVFEPATGAVYGCGHNGPPNDVCPGRQICAGQGRDLAVHAEIRAMREAAIATQYDDRRLDLVHVELAPDATVVACAGPSCVRCSVEILDGCVVDGVWLYEEMTDSDYLEHERRFSGMRGLATSLPDPPDGIWRRYTAAEFHRVTLERAGVVTAQLRPNTQIPSR